MDTKKSTILKGVVVMLLWGSLFPCIKLSYSALRLDTSVVGNIMLLAGIRFAVCGSLICAFCKLNKFDMKPCGKSDTILLLLVGLFAVVLHYGFTYTSLSLIDSSKTALIKQLGVLFFICFSFVFFKDDRLSPRKILSAIFGVCGIIALNTNALHISLGIGELLVVAASFCTVFSNVFGKKLTQRMSPIVMTGYSQLLGGLVLVFVGLFARGRISHISPEAAGLFIYICASSIISYCIWNSLVKSTNLSELFIVKFLEPIFAGVFSAVLLCEDIFTPQYLISTAMVVLSVTVLYLKPNGRKVN